jgi:hypothetical protein
MDAAIAAIELLRGNVEPIPAAPVAAEFSHEGAAEIASKFAPRPAIPETPYDPENPDSGEVRYV